MKLDGGACYQDFHGVYLYNEKAYEIMGFSTKEEDEILPGIYMNPRTRLDVLTKAIKLEERGVFDYAVPQSWFDEQLRCKRSTRAVWFYPKEGNNRLFGGPYYISDMKLEFKKMLQDEMAKDFLEKDPEKVLKSFSLWQCVHEEGRFTAKSDYQEIELSGIPVCPECGEDMEFIEEEII